MKIPNIEKPEFEELCKLIFLGYLIINSKKKNKDIKPLTNKSMYAFFNLNIEYKSALLDIYDEEKQYVPTAEMEDKLANYIEKIFRLK